MTQNTKRLTLANKADRLLDLATQMVSNVEDPIAGDTFAANFLRLNLFRDEVVSHLNKRLARQLHVVATEVDMKALSWWYYRSGSLIVTLSTYNGPDTTGKQVEADRLEVFQPENLATNVLRIRSGDHTFYASQGLAKAKYLGLMGLMNEAAEGEPDIAYTNQLVLGAEGAFEPKSPHHPIA